VVYQVQVVDVRTVVEDVRVALVEGTAHRVRRVTRLELRVPTVRFGFHTLRLVLRVMLHLRSVN
jgi:hypothetical protein